MNPYRAALQARTTEIDSNYPSSDVPVTQQSTISRDFTQVDESSIDWETYRKWLINRYSKNYARITYAYSKRYFSVLHDIKSIDLIKPTNKNNVIKALSTLSKFLGLSNEFTSKIKSYGVKRHRVDSLQSFLRILNASDSDIMNWYRNALPSLNPNEQLYLQLLKLSGLRMSEGVNCFNLIITLSREKRLDEYYDSKLCCLMHFKYTKLFIRNTKNAYITFLPKALIAKIAKSETVCYQVIQKKLHRSEHNNRMNELRDYFGTFVVNHGVSRDEQDLLCGRIPVSIFIRHYWSPRLSDLRDRVLKALSNIESSKLIQT